MAAIVDMFEAEDGSGYWVCPWHEVKVEWFGFDKKENMLEALARICDAAPEFFKDIKL